MKLRWDDKLFYGMMAFLVVGAGFIYWATWRGSTDDIKRVANQLQVPGAWKLIGESANPPSTLCIGDVACPSLGRTWQVPYIPTQNEMKQILMRSGWKHVVVDRECLERNIDSPKEFLCSNYGDVDKYAVSVSISDSYLSTNQPTVNLYIRSND